MLGISGFVAFLDMVLLVEDINIFFLATYTRSLKRFGSIVLELHNALCLFSVIERSRITNYIFCQSTIACNCMANILSTC